MVRDALTGIVADERIRLVRGFAQPSTEKPRYVEVWVATPTYGMPSETWARQRESMARVRRKLDETGLRYAQHGGVIIVLNRQVIGRQGVDDVNERVGG
jgi:hypothetical protein